MSLAGRMNLTSLCCYQQINTDQILCSKRRSVDSDFYFRNRWKLFMISSLKYHHAASMQNVIKEPFRSLSDDHSRIVIRTKKEKKITGSSVWSVGFYQAFSQRWLEAIANMLVIALTLNTFRTNPFRRSSLRIKLTNTMNIPIPFKTSRLTRVKLGSFPSIVFALIFLKQRFRGAVTWNHFRCIYASLEKVLGQDPTTERSLLV